MRIRLRQHAGEGLVAGAFIVAALLEGLFDPIAFAAASVLLWAAVIAGLVSRSLPLTPVSGVAAVAGSCLAGLSVLSILSIGWVGDRGLAFEEGVRWSAYLGVFALAVGTASAGAVRQWLAGLAAGTGIVTVLALLSYLQPGLLEGDELDRLIPSAAGRASYPIGYWNGLGALLASAVLLLSWAGVRAETRGVRSAAVSLLPLALLGIWLTGSRGAAIAVLLGLVLLVGASPRPLRQASVLAQGLVGGAIVIIVAESLGALTSDVVDADMRSDGDVMTAVAALVAIAAGVAAVATDGWEPRVPRPSRPAAAGLAALGAVVLVVGVAVADPVQAFEDFRSPPELDGAGDPPVGAGLSSSGRWQFWDEAVQAFRSDPVTGVGAGGYEDWWSTHAHMAVYVQNPHSLPLQAAGELGILGFGLVLGFAAAVGLAAWRVLRSARAADGGILVALVAAGAVGTATDWTWAIPAVAAPALVASGLLTARASRGEPRDRYWLGLATGVLAWFTIIAAGLVILTQLKLDQSREAVAAGRLGDAVERAEDAREVQPWSSAPYLQLALVQEELGDREAALDTLAEAVERDQGDWRLPLIEARLHEELGDDAAAAAARYRAAELSPIFGGLAPSEQ